MVGKEIGEKENENEYIFYWKTTVIDYDVAAELITCSYFLAQSLYPLHHIRLIVNPSILDNRVNCMAKNIRIVLKNTST